jgi:hypothetical protein
VGPYSTELLGLLAALLILVAVGVLLFLVVRARIARRKRALSDDIASSEARIEERAFNQLKIDESEIAVLQREGIDVTRARGQLAEAQRAFDRRDFFSAYQSARLCHDRLVAQRRTPTSPDPGAFTLADPLEGPALGADGAPAGAVPAAPPPPRNRMESRFQLSLLTEELADAGRSRPSDPALPSAQRLAADARAQADRGEYTDALGTALKARRLLGGRVESIKPSLAAAAAAEPTGPARAAPPGPDPGSCSRCGRAMRPTDGFCRGCGAPRGAGRCGRCGTPMEPNDQFCPACGAAQAPPPGASPSS